MTEAGRIVALVHEKLKEVIVPGITTNEIDQICDKIIREHGATPSFLHLYGFPNSVCTSINEVVVHGIPSNRKLKDGDVCFPIMLEHVTKDIMVTVLGLMQ